MNILLKRAGALGDVLCVTPILARLKHENPDADIFVDTGRPEAFVGNPLYLPASAMIGSPDRTIVLDLAYENHPSMHVVDAYMTETFGDPGAPEERAIDFRWKQTGKMPWRYATLHAARSWPSRTLPTAFWDDVANCLMTRGLMPLFIGGPNDYRGPSCAHATIAHNYPLALTAGFIAGSQVFIGSDSALIHVAGATETPIVGLYTSVKAAYRMPYRHGRQDWRAVGLEAEIACQGCLERAPVPSTGLNCERGDNACTAAISVDRVLEAVEELLC